MTDQELELKLKKAVESCTPDVLDKVMAECDNYKNKVIPFEKKKYSFRRYATAAAACLLVIGAGVFGMNTKRIASIVSFEVNPSVELCISSKEKVLEANALNEDAEVILEGMKLEGLDVHTATNAIVGSLLKNGYIDELANSILLSVEDDDAVRGEELQETLSEEIDAILSGAAVSASIISQYVEGDGVDQISEEYHISHGKAALIEHILEANDTYSFEELAQLSVNELNIIISNSKNEIKDIHSTGQVTAGAYIGAEKANKIAFAHAGIAENTIYNLEVEMDYEYHTMIYDVDFSCGTAEYEYYIDAVSGEIIEYEVEFDD